MSPKVYYEIKQLLNQSMNFTSGGFKPIITEEHDAEKVKKLF